jgi:hypothetical protein
VSGKSATTSSSYGAPPAKKEAPPPTPEAPVDDGLRSFPIQRGPYSGHRVRVEFLKGLDRQNMQDMFALVSYSFLVSDLL